MTTQTKNKPPELQTHETPLDFDNLPILPLYWYILVQPMAIPETTKGGIIKADTHVRAEEIMTTLGEIVAMGPGACTGKTESGCDLRRAISLHNTPGTADDMNVLNDCRSLQVGDWILYAKYTGHEIKTKSGHRLLLLGDSDILAYVPDPREIVLW